MNNEPGTAAPARAAASSPVRLTLLYHYSKIHFYTKHCFLYILLNKHTHIKTAYTII